MLGCTSKCTPRVPDMGDEPRQLTHVLSDPPQGMLGAGSVATGSEQGLSCPRFRGGDTVGLQAVLGPEASESAEQGQCECACVCASVRGGEGQVVNVCESVWV